MGATYNNKAKIVEDDNIITAHSVPNVRLDSKMIEAIRKAFKLSGKYVREGEVSKTVQNSVAQYANNSRSTGRVVLKVKGRSKPITVDIFDYWPSWSIVTDKDGKESRFYSKNHGANVINLMQSGKFSNPTSQVLEHIAYTAISVVKSRQNTPREGLIKAQVLEYLESTGIKVVKCWYKGNQFDRDFLTSKIKKMRSIFDAMQSIGEFAPIEKKPTFQIGIIGQ